MSTNPVKTLLESLLDEAEAPDRPESMADFAPVEEKPVSLDQAIDQFLVQYEKEAIPTNETYVESHRRLSSVLLEQEDDEGLDLGADEGAEDEDAGGDEGGGLDLDLGGDDAGGDDEAGEEGAPGEEGGDGEDAASGVFTSPTINLQDFGRSVARLVSNADNLIDIKTLILNRAESYIKNNYDQRTAEEFLNMMDTHFDLQPTNTAAESESQEEWPEVYAGVTGPVG